MPPAAGVAAVWSQIIGTPAGERPADAFQPPRVELRFILAGDARSCGEYDVWYRLSASGPWSRTRTPAEERTHDIGGFEVSKTDFPMALCRLPMKTDWFEAAVSEKGEAFKPVPVWSPTGKTVRTIVAGGAGIGRRNGRVDQIVMVTLGDTGCRGTPIGAPGRMSQDCSADWPFADLMDSAVEVKLDDGSMARPDFFVHVGDYRYFWEDYEIDPAKGSGSGNQGYSKDTLGYWLQDFLTPAQPALAIAPWALSRGNHETCPDAGPHWYGKGWTYLFGDVDWPPQPCNNLVPTTYFDVGPGGGNDSRTRHRVVMIDSSNPYGTADKGRNLTDLFNDAAAVTRDGNAAYVNSTHWVSHIPAITYQSYCDGQCGDRNQRVLQAVSDAFGGTAPCEDRGPGVPRCVPSTLFAGHQHFYQRIRLSDPKSPDTVSVTWTWPQTQIVGHGGTKPDHAAFTPHWCRTEITVPKTPSGETYKANVIADSRHGFVVWRRAADTLSDPAGWKETRYWHTGAPIPQPAKDLHKCRLD
jgi:hypothetical protein